MNDIRATAQQLAEVEFIIVALAVGIATVNSAWLPWALLVTALFWPVRRIATGRWSRRTPVDWPVVVLLLITPLTLWASSVPEKTAPQVLRLLIGIGLFYAVANIPLIFTSTKPIEGQRGIHLVVNGTLAVGLSLAILAPFLVQWNASKLGLFPTSWYSRFQMLPVDPANPNVMAGSLVLLLPLAVGLLTFSWRSLRAWERLLTLAFLLTGSIILLLTQSRGAWIAFGCALAVLVILRFRRGWVAVLILALVGVLIAAGLGVDRVISALAGGTTPGGMAGRIEVWSRALYMVQDFPFTGIGIGAFTEVADRLYPFLLYAPETMEHAHNLFLQVAVDLGLLGFVAWLAVLFGSIYSAWRVAQRGKSYQATWQWGLGAGLLAAQAALIAHGMTDSVTWGMVRTAPLVWLLWGISAVVTG